MTKLSLENKVALVTGGGSGIGKAISLTFAGQGATVHILEYNLSAAEKTCIEIIDSGGFAEAHQCDVSNQKNVTKIIQKISKSNAVDILINNAGVSHIGNIEVVEETLPLL